MSSSGYKLLKRKGVAIDDFSLSSPATKIRRLDAELPPIAEVELEQEQPLPVPVPHPPNQERALVLFKPLLHSSSPFSLTLNPNLISQFNNQVPWSEQRDSDCDRRLLRSAAAEREQEEEEEEEKKNRGLALVPWVPSLYPTLHDSNAEFMESDELGGPEAEAGESTMMMMDIEQQDDDAASNPSALTLNHDFHQWQQQQNQQHCLLPQLPQNPSTPITWTR